MRKLFTLKKLNLFLLGLIILQTPVFLAAVLYLPNHTRYVTATTEVKFSSRSDKDIEFEQINSVEKQTKDTNDLFVTGWIPDYDIPDGLNVVKEQKDNFDSISPVWFWVNENGSLQKNGYTNGKEFIAFTNQNNIELIPTITLFDHEILNKVLNSDENFNRHINEIVKNVVDNQYDGIDLDYESTYLKDKDKFFDFLEELSSQLHALDKKLVFTVLSKWGDLVEYNSLPQTRLTQDYKRISDLVDEFRIMTYDFYGAGSVKAGPIAPLEWMEFVIKYAIYTGVPREKIVLGVHTYAYDWTERDIATNIVVDNEFKVGLFGNSDPADAYFYKDVEKVKNQYNLTENFNDKWGEAIGEYTFENQKRIVVYPTQKSFELRKELAAEYGLKGVAYWRVGDSGSLKY